MRQGAAGVGRRLAIAIGCGEHKHLPAGGRGLKILQRAGVHAVAVLAQCVLQCLGKAPGAATFTGDEDQHVGLCQGAVACDVRRLLAGLPPDDDARQPEQQHAGAYQPEHHGPRPGAFAGVQHQSPVVDPLRHGAALRGQGLSRIAVDPAFALNGGHLPRVLRVSGVGKVQPAQILHAEALQHGKLCRGQCGLAGDHGGRIGFGPGIQRDQPQRRGAHGQRRDRRQEQHRQHHPAHEHVESLRQRATHPRRQLPPAAHAAQQQHQARDAQQRHTECNACRTPASGVAQQ